MHELLHTAFSHISCVLRWTGTSDIIHGSFPRASLHISCVWNQSGTYINGSGSVRIASLHISCVLRWSGTYLRVYRSLRTASLHISSVLRCSGTYSNEYDSMRTNSSCIFFEIWNKSQHARQGCAGIPKHFLKQVNHFYSYTWPQPRIKCYGHAKTIFESIL